MNPFSHLSRGVRRRPRSCVANWHQRGVCGGYTIVELLIAVAIVAGLSGIAIPVFSSQIEKTRIARACVEIRMLEKQIKLYETDNYALPDSMTDIGQGGLRDPWGNAYQYLKVEGTPQGQLRKDRFMVPVNSDYDLYSIGKDGKSQSPFTAKNSRDDVVRANDGGYVGLASEF